jgi:DNA replication protein DnaC
MNSTYIQIKENARSLSLYNLCANIDKILSPSNETIPNTKFLNDLLSKEIDYREQRSREKRYKQAQLPTVKSLADFDTNFQTSITRGELDTLGELTWIETMHNLVLLGPPGVGKTHIALSLAALALDNGCKVFFTSMDRLMHILKTQEISKSSRARLSYIHACDLVIVDELGYLPISRTEANLFFQLITKLHDSASLIITSNKGFDQWSTVFGDGILATAMLDRLTYRCQIIPLDGDSYRLHHRTEIFSKP